MLAFLLLNLRSIITAAVGAGAMFAVWYIVDIFDDRAVAREARREYVKVSELEAAKADARINKELFDLSQKHAYQLAADKSAYQEAFNEAIDQIEFALKAREDAQDEINTLLKNRPDGVPTVSDLGVRLRN